MLPLIGLLIAAPIFELYVIIKVGEAIGLWPTLGLLLADALLGALLLRYEGRGAWRRFNRALAERRFPGREVADGLMIAVGGTLLLTPGFVTDILGFLLLIPPTRAISRRLLQAWVARRFVVVGMSGPGTARPGYSRGPDAADRPYDFEGTAEEIDSDDFQLPEEGR